MSVNASAVSKESKIQIELQAKEKQLEEAVKAGDKAKQAKAYYQLGLFYAKRDRNKAKDAFNKTIALNADNEITAYALKERTLYYTGGKGETEVETLSDLKNACELLDNLKEIKEDPENKERRRTYLYYGEALIETPAVAVPILRKALQLDPANIRIIKALLQAQFSIKAYTNVFECMEDIGFGENSLKLIEEFTKASGLLPLWLEAARSGMVDLIQNLAKHNSRLECTLNLFSKAPQPLEVEQVPALIFENNSFELIVSNNIGLQKIKAPQGIELKTLTEFFQNNKNQKKISLPSDHPIIKWIRLSGGHNSTIRDTDNNTAFHYASKEGHVGLIEVLERYEDYYAQNKMGLTPLLFAAQYGKLEMVMALLSRAPNSAIAQNDLLSVLVTNEQEQILNAVIQQRNIYDELLINVGKFHLKNKDNQPDRKLMKEAAIGQMYKTALDVESMVMLKFLIQVHPEGLKILYKGQSPLHYAIQCQFAEAVHLLVESGSDLALPNATKMRPLELAKKEALDLVPYLNNAEGKVEQRKKEIAQEKIEAEKNRLAFVTRLAESFSKQKLPGEKTVLQNNNNLTRLREVLKEAVKSSEFDNFFVPKAYPNTAFLIDAINKMLLQKIQKNELTKSRFIGCDLFERKSLSAALSEIIRSPWQSTIRVDSKDVKEQKEVKEQRDIRAFNVLSQTQVVFCEHFEKQLDEAYSYLRAIHSGEMVSKKDLEEQRKLEMIKGVAAHLPNIPIPTPVGSFSIPTGAAVSGVLTLIQYFKEYYRKKEAARMVDLFRAVTPYERTHFIRYTAEQIAYKYRNQIHHLMPGSEGVEVFAQCAAARVVEYITSDDSHQIGYEPSILGGVIRQLKSLVLNQEIPPELQQQKSLYDIFLDGIVRVTSKFPTDRYTLQTINHLTQQDKWCSKEIFENTGIMISSGDRYAHPQVNIERYGYCYGTMKEAEKRALTLGPKKSVLWGFGRQWEQVEQTLALDALPTNHAQPSKVLVFSVDNKKVLGVDQKSEKKDLKLGK